MRNDVPYMRGHCIWALMRDNLSLGFVSNKGADKLEHPLSLIRTIVIPLLGP